MLVDQRKVPVYKDGILQVATMKIKKRHYVNNADFLEAMKQYRAKCAAADHAGKQIPPIPSYIGECFMQIATRLSTKPNFIRYPFRDDMIADGLENAVRCVGNFDPDKSNNPFAYFTQVIYFAFLRRIEAEQRFQYTTHRAIEQAAINSTHVVAEGGVDLAWKRPDAVAEFIQSFEDKMATKRQKAKARADKVSTDK